MPAPTGPISLRPPPEPDDDADPASIREGLEALTVLLEREAAARSDREEAATDRSERRSRILTRYVLPAVVTVLAGGGVGGYQLAARPADGDGDGVEAIGRQLDRGAAGDQARADDLDGKIRRLAERSVAQEVLVTESIRYLGDKIDRIAPRQSGAVEKPPSLRAAEKRVDAIKREKAVDEIFAETGG